MDNIVLIRCNVCGTIMTVKLQDLWQMGSCVKCGDDDLTILEENNTDEQ